MMKGATFLLALAFIALHLSCRAVTGHQTNVTATSIAPSTTVLPEGPADGYQALDVVGKTPTGLLRLRGYEGHVHYAVTQDGYHIHLVRIVNPLLKQGTQLKRPVVFNHGLIESSTIWLINSKGMRPEVREGFCETLPLNVAAIKNSTSFTNGPMMLANHNYDVWLMSMRGTDFSMYNQELEPSNPEFWDYSLDNFALDDVPTVINYVRRQTGSKKVAYVGHSQATFSVFGLLAARPEYADIIEPVVAVAPVAYMYHTTSIARTLFMSSLDTPNIQGPLPETAGLVRASLTRMCAKNGLTTLRIVCGLVDALVGGLGTGTRKGYFAHFPFYTSRKVWRHFGQLVKKKQFSMYDHGPQENERRYGSPEAPLYKVGNIRSRSITLIWTKTDTLSDVRDVNRFKSELRVPIYRDVFINRIFNHFDLINNVEARYLVWVPVLEVLEEFEQRNGACHERAEQELEGSGYEQEDTRSNAYSNYGQSSGDQNFL